MPLTGRKVKYNDSDRERSRSRWDRSSHRRESSDPATSKCRDRTNSDDGRNVM